MKSYYFDSHAHIASSSKSYDSVDDVIKRAKKAEVVKVVDAGVDLETSKAVIKLAKKYPYFIIPTVGIQPEVLIPGSDIYDRRFRDGLRQAQSTGTLNQQLGELKNIVTKNRNIVGAIGECGLDYYWIIKNKGLSQNSKVKSQKLQRVLFTELIQIAKEFGLPLVVHSRGAEEECLEIINNQLPIIRQHPINNNQHPGAISQEPRALFHCYTGSIETAKKILDAGYYMSFNGILTYKNAENVREIFEMAWRNYKEQVLAETDSPLLMPRGMVQASASTTLSTGGVEPTVNEPANIPIIVAKMAEVVGCGIEEVAEVIMRNAMSFLE
jgi:TatD DNase family protein